MSPTRRRHPTWICALLAIGLASCGRVAPWFAPAPPAPTGTLVVSSTPAGAAIELDGAATGRTTPDTLRDVPAGHHVVRALRAGWAAAPESVTVELAARGLAHAAFTLVLVQSSQPVVLLEGFSNVNCVGCPQMSANLDELMSEPGHGLDRVVLIKYAANWPALNDPHYQANPADNSARLTFYQPYLTVGIPTLVVDGALAGASGEPPTLESIRALVDAKLATDPGVEIGLDAVALAGDVSVQATAVVRARRALAGANVALVFALVQNPVSYRSPPGNQGETVFHHVMRDLATAGTNPLPLAAGDSAVRTVTLDRLASWPVTDLHVVAFLQDTQTREVLQAAHAPVSFALAARAPSSFPVPHPNVRSRSNVSALSLSRHSHPGGRP